MVLWGGLRPIASQLVADVIALTIFGCTTVSQPSRNSMGLMLAGSFLAIAISGNLTNRWTIIFPMIPLGMLQCLRMVVSKKWISALIFIASLLLILASAALSILFPAVEMPPIASSIAGELNVGIVDMYLPVDLTFSSHKPNIDES
jgi:hypothetical protein